MLIAEYTVKDSADIDEKTLSDLNIVSRVYLNLPSEALLQDDITSFEKLFQENSRLIVGPFLPNFIQCSADWLNNGASQILIDLDSCTCLDEIEKVVKELEDIVNTPQRLLIAFSMKKMEKNDDEFVQKICDMLRNRVGGIVLSDMETMESEIFNEKRDVYLKMCHSIRRKINNDVSTIVHDVVLAVSKAGVISSEDVSIFHDKTISILTPARVQIKNVDLPTDMLDAGLSFVACLKTDRPDGLFATVVADESGVALGLVYSSKESILQSLSTKRGVYYSRSRNGLWEKGLTSGHYQELISVDVDCDSDALRFLVHQYGSFCHLNTKTCWGESKGLQHLQSTLEDRKEHIDKDLKSYTRRLFKDEKLLRNKLVEEAQELAEAETHTDIAGEAADLIYFAMVRCVKAGVSISDFENVLDRRALKVKRRPGNDKEYRIQAAKEILEMKKSKQ